jgi:hypothetical protein
MGTLLLLALMTHAALARDFHVSPNGNDNNDGSSSKPYKTISKAAEVAQPGDAITVHEGTYRERVTPPRGGQSDATRIVYQAAPTAEQIGLIGTHWSKGWIIENNVISDSKCSGITLGKDRKTGHNVWSKDRSKDGAIHNNEVVVRALEAGWSREKIGSHIVRNNTISDCEQTGICGSLGAAFSQIANNHIYNIWTKRQFGGAEMAGIKIHASIDMLIKNNRLHNTGRAMWMDWMAQGTRITGNLCYDNSTDDLYVEVDHGPYLVDNNLFLSGISLFDMSEGGAYVHNLMTRKIVSFPERGRSTPYHQAHSTALAGLKNITGGDNRFYNNILVSGTGGDQARDHRTVGEGQDSGALLRECRRLAPGHRHRLFRQNARQGETVRRPF